MKTILTAITCYCLTLIACLAANITDKLSAETVAAIRLPEGGAGQWATGIGASYSANKFVAVTARVLSYEPANGSGNLVDEASAGVEAKLLKSANGKLGLNAIGGVKYGFELEDWGMALGGRATASVYGPLYAFGESEWIVWQEQPQELRLSFGVGIKF